MQRNASTSGGTGFSGRVGPTIAFGAGSGIGSSGSTSAAVPTFGRVAGRKSFPGASRPGAGAPSGRFSALVLDSYRPCAGRIVTGPIFSLPTVIVCGAGSLPVVNGAKGKCLQPGTAAKAPARYSSSERNRRSMPSPQADRAEGDNP